MDGAVIEIWVQIMSMTRGSAVEWVNLILNIFKNIFTLFLKKYFFLGIYWKLLSLGQKNFIKLDLNLFFQ